MTTSGFCPAINACLGASMSLLCFSSPFWFAFNYSVPTELLQCKWWYRPCFVCRATAVAPRSISFDNILALTINPFSHQRWIDCALTKQSDYDNLGKGSMLSNFQSSSFTIARYSVWNSTIVFRTHMEDLST